MRTTGLALLVVLMVVAVSGARAARAAPAGESEVELYYVPFDSESYAPVTPDSIERDALCKLGLTARSKEAVALRKALSAAGRGAFDPKFVRLKAVGLRTGDLLVDMQGGLRGAELVGRKLSADGLKELKGLIDGLAKKQGCRP